MMMSTHYNTLNISFIVNFPFKYSNSKVPCWGHSGEGGGGWEGEREGDTHHLMMQSYCHDLMIIICIHN